MSLGKFPLLFYFVQLVSYWFLEISLVSLFRGMARTRGGWSGLFQSGLQTDPHFGVDVDTEVEPGPQHRPEI